MKLKKIINGNISRVKATSGTKKIDGFPVWIWQKTFRTLWHAYTNGQWLDIHCFLSLLNHKNCYVRLYAAFFLLDLYKDEAEKVLLELSQESGLIGFTSEMTLKEWKKKNKIN